MGGFSIGYGISVSPRLAAFDPDALAYFTTAGITSDTAKIQINGFVKGIKDLGLWSSMVSWPLRSSQNAGTGTTAYSLGGLGTFNGTLVNTPTWTTDGVDMNANDKRITTSATANQPDTIFSVQTMTSENTTQIVYDGAQRQHLYRNPSEGFAQGFAGASIALPSFTANQFFSTQLEFNGASGSYSFNGGNKVTANFGANNLTSFRMGSAFGNQKGVLLAFVAIIRSGSVSILHNLYKSTLGEGLGLP